MKSSTLSKILASAVALAVFVPAFTQTVRVDKEGRPDRMSKIPPRHSLNAQDRRSVMDAALSNMLEIHSSRIALNRGSSTWVKGFARDMIREHSIAQAELGQIARGERIRLPSKPPKAIQTQLNRLRRLRGAAFDRAYRNLQIAGHQATVGKFERGIKFGSDSHVRGYLVKNLPGVREHLEMAKKRQTMMTNDM